MFKRIIISVFLVCLVFGTIYAQNANQHVRQGEQYMSAHNYTDAITSFEAALRLEPRNKKAESGLRDARTARAQQLFNQGQSLHQQENYFEAIEHYNSAIRSAPPGYSNLRMIQGRLSEAQRALDEQIAERQKAIEEHSAQERARLERERTEQSRQFVQRANEHFLASQYDEAITTYEFALSNGGLPDLETAEINRLNNEAKDFKEKTSSAVNRPLVMDDFDLAPNSNAAFGGVVIVKYKGVHTKSVNVAGKTHSVFYGILDVDIPARLANQAVTSIGPNAFRDTGITSVKIPSTVREIQVGAFANNKIKSVTITQASNPRTEGLIEIKGGISQGIIEVTELGAFENNPDLETIVIPNTVTIIGARAFRGCGLRSVMLGSLVREIGESAFRNNHLPVVTIPPSVLIIRRYAFHGNQIIAQTISATIDVIFDNAFTNNPMTSLVFLPSAKWSTEYRLLTNNIPMMVPRLGGDHFMYTTPTPVFPVDTLTQITLAANMHTRNMELFDPNLKTFYENMTATGPRKTQGTYIREMSGNTTIWSKR